MLSFSPEKKTYNLPQAAKDGSGLFVDGYNRVRIFRGFNDLQYYRRNDACRAKGIGPYIRNCNYLPHYLQNDSVVLLLEKQGFNVMRTPMMWAATRPQENTTDVEYLKDSKAIVDKVNLCTSFSILAFGAVTSINSGILY